MSSEVSVANIALQKIGAERIVSLTADSTNARAVNACYAEMRDAELEAHPWNFARKRVTLTEDSVAPEFYFGHQFTLPTDCLRVILEEQWRSPLDWQIEDGFIRTNEGGTLQVVYVRRVTDPNAMPATFREVLACRIAKQVCKQLTGSTSDVASIDEQRKIALAEARRSNAFQRTQHEQAQDSWERARF